MRFLLEIDRVKQWCATTPWPTGPAGRTTPSTCGTHADEPVDLRAGAHHGGDPRRGGDRHGRRAVYDEEGCRAVAAAERAAADRVFGLLPADQPGSLRALWAEFEARESPDAWFAAAVDRLQPLLLNLAAGGGAWTAEGVTAAHARAADAHIAAGSERLWGLAQKLIGTAEAAGLLAGPP